MGYQESRKESRKESCKESYQESRKESRKESCKESFQERRKERRKESRKESRTESKKDGDNSKGVFKSRKRGTEEGVVEAWFEEDAVKEHFGKVDLRPRQDNRAAGRLCKEHPFQGKLDVKE